VTTPTLTRDEVAALVTRRQMLQSRLAQISKWATTGIVDIAAARIQRATVIAQMDECLDALIAARAWTAIGARSARDANRRYRVHQVPEWCK
jgi:hypothetical protein